LIWLGNIEELHQFFEYINSLHDSIKLTFDYSKKEVNFLDTTIYLNKNRNIQTKLYRKPTDKKSLLHNSSNHPEHTKESVIYSLALRYRTITTDDNILKLELKELKNHLLSRGYIFENIKKNFEKIDNISQKQLVFNKTLDLNTTDVNRTTGNITLSNFSPKTKKVDPNTCLPFVIPYTKHFDKLSTLILKHWYIIKNDLTLNEIFPDKPFVSFQRTANLKDHLTKSEFFRDHPGNIN